MAKERIELTAEEQAKVRECLQILQEAQNMINYAAQALCPVRGFGDEWEKLSETYEAVKSAWYMVERRRVGLRPAASQNERN